MAELDTKAPFSLYSFSSKASSLSLPRIENLSDTAGADSGLTGFFFNFSFLDAAERLGVVPCCPAF